MFSWFWRTTAGGSCISALPPTPPLSGLPSNSATPFRGTPHHVIVFHEASLYRQVKSFLAYYHESRTHLSLAKDTPEPRPVHPPELGAVVAIPQVGGLHHRYERHAA
jgi:hypothetical protein